MKDWKEFEEQMKQELPLPEHVLQSFDSALEHLPEKKRRRWSMIQKIAAAIAFVVLVPAGAYAAGRYVFETRSKGNMEAVGMQGDMAGTIEVPALDIQFGYVPEGFLQNDPLHYSVSGEPSGVQNKDGFFAGQYDGVPIALNYVVNREEIVIQDYRAYCYEMEAESVTGFCNYIFMISDKVEGEMVFLGGMENVPMEELKKIAENLIITPTDQTIEIQNTDLSEKFQEIEGYASADWCVTLPEEDKAEDKIIKIIGDDAEYTSQEFGTLELKDVQITDNIAGLSPENFVDYDGMISPYVNQDGTFKPFERISHEYGEDGISQKREKIGLRVVRATFEVTNTLDKEMEFWTGRILMHPTSLDGDGGYQVNTKEYDNFEMGLMERWYPVYFDQPTSVSKEERNHFFYRKIPAGESLTYTVAYITYEDEVDGISFIFDQDLMGLQKATYELNGVDQVKAPFIRIE